MPGKPSARRSRVTAGVMTPRSSAISGRSRPQIARRGVERRAARAAAPAPGQRVARAPRHRPVGDEAAEVVDPRDVAELERAPQALGPPVVAAPPQRRPVVERVAPQLPLVRVGVGRRAGDGLGREQLGVRAMVDRPGGDVDRHVADQLHAAVLRVRAQRRPLAVEPHLVGDRAALRPVLDPERVPLAKARRGLLGHRRPRLGEQSRPGGERRRRLVRRAVPVGWPERQHLPPRLPRVGQPVDEPVRLAAEPAGGERGRVQLDAAGTREVHQRAMSDTPATHARP